MSAPKFTPGPWNLDAGRCIVTSSGTFYLGYGSHPKSGNPEFRNFVELDNNARLIAAAPELYAALEMLVRFHESEPQPGLSSWHEWLARSLEQARSALGKAGWA